MNKTIKPGLTIDQHISHTGETVYTVCDAIGVIFTTIFPNRLELFFAESA